ncbi:MAG: serine/threonine-protein kinase [Myxococcota bacterium]
MDDGSWNAAGLMGAPPPADALREELALATLQRRMFDSKAPAPVLHRYVLLDTLGHGGFGVVLRAFDPDLERAVAIKLLRVDAAADDDGVEALLREARIMARLSHPNTVTVHDVGRYDRHDLGAVGTQAADLGIPVPGVFLVMELVEQGTLQQRLDAGASPSSLFGLLLDAGAGLAAAHALGVVHRDVKPNNILIDADERVRVADFGLSQTVERAKPGAGGTPAFMAPERMVGGAATPASDQYAFALTCTVALWRVPPAHARVLFDDVAPVPDGLSARVRPVLARALHSDPAARYPTLPDLLGALEDAQRPRVRPLWIGGAVTVAAGIGLALLATRDDPCAHAGDGLATSWDAPARARLRGAFADVSPTHAADSSNAVERALDDYASRWASAATEACVDTHVRHVQSEDRLDARVDCLGRLRIEFAEAVSLLAEADAQLLPRAVDVVHGLGWIDACETPDGAAHLPNDPDARDRHAQRSRQLARAKLLEVSGRYTEAMALAQAVRDSPDASPISRARARLRWGSAAAGRGLYDDAKRALLAAIQDAEAARADAIVVDGWLRLLWVAGVELGEPQGDTWAAFARAALTRLGDDPRREAELAHGLGGLAYRQGRYDDALAHYQRALAMQRSTLAEDDAAIARTLNHIANTLLELHEPADAAPYVDQALAVRRRVLGERHPLVAAALNNRVRVELGRGDVPAALRTLAEAERITDGLDLPEAVVSARLRQDILRDLAERP